MATNKINRRVKDDHLGITGSINKTSSIRVDGKLQTVYGVKWDGNPVAVPAMWRDEDGSSRKGYRENDLTWL